MSASVPFTLDTPTALSLGAVLSIMPVASILSIILVPSGQTRNRFLFFWHAYDALTHMLVEGSFLYHCFFSYTTIASLRGTEPHFLTHSDRLYGPAYGTDASARMWQEYAKADRRWAGADIGVISLELLTVFLGTPAAFYVCYQTYQSSRQRSDASATGSAKAKMWIVATALAICELYGGFMTFAPEWLSGNTQLETDDPVYLWLYLFFFNTLWVFIPFWVLTEAWKEAKRAFVGAETASRGKKTT